MKLGEKIKHLRETKGLSVRKAASLLEISHSMLGNVEAGRTFPGDELMKRLSDFYGVPFVELLSLEAVDRGRIEIPAGVHEKDVVAAVYLFARVKAPDDEPSDPHAFHCPKCGAGLVCHEQH